MNSYLYIYCICVTSIKVSLCAVTCVEEEVPYVSFHGIFKLGQMIREMMAPGTASVREHYITVRSVFCGAWIRTYLLLFDVTSSFINSIYLS